MAATRTSRTGEGGFTLIEVIVAITILGISLAALLGIFSQALTRAHARDRAFAARMLAQDMLARAEISQSLDFGETKGRAESGLFWRLQVTHYGKDDSHAALLSADVGWAGEAKAQSVSLATLRLLPAER